MNIRSETLPVLVDDSDQNTESSARKSAKKKEGGGVISNNMGEKPKWLTPTNKSLVAILALDNNWDSYGAKRILPRVAEAVSTLLYTIMQIATPVPQIVPSANGSIQLEWHQKGIDLEIEVKSFSEFCVFFEDAQNEEPAWEGDINADLTKLVYYINILTSRA